MNAKEILQAFREVFPGSMVMGKDDVSLPVDEGRKAFWCNYQGELRVVDDAVCQYHLEAFDPWCRQKCETEWAIKKHRSALTPENCPVICHATSKRRRGPKEPRQRAFVS